MQINIVQTPNIELSDSLSDYLHKKLTSVADKFIPDSDESAQCNVDIGKTTEHHQSGPYYRAEFNLHVAGKNLIAEAEEEDLYAAIDEAKSELARQLRKHYDKRETMLRKGGRKLKAMFRRES